MAKLHRILSIIQVIRFISITTSVMLIATVYLSDLFVKKKLKKQGQKENVRKSNKSTSHK